MFCESKLRAHVGLIVPFGRCAPTGSAAHYNIALYIGTRHNDVLQKKKKKKKCRVPSYIIIIIIIIKVRAHRGGRRRKKRPSKEIRGRHRDARNPRRKPWRKKTAVARAPPPPRCTRVPIARSVNRTRNNNSNNVYYVSLWEDRV